MADQPVQVNKLKTKITKGDMFKTFVFENFQQASFNFERIHALAFCVDMIPTIKRVYSKKEDQVAALKRHLVFSTQRRLCVDELSV